MNTIHLSYDCSSPRHYYIYSFCESVCVCVWVRVSVLLIFFLFFFEGWNSIGFDACNPFIHWLDRLDIYWNLLRTKNGGNEVDNVITIEENRSKTQNSCPALCEFHFQLNFLFNQIGSQQDNQAKLSSWDCRADSLKYIPIEYKL